MGHGALCAVGHGGEAWLLWLAADLSRHHGDGARQVVGQGQADEATGIENDPVWPEEQTETVFPLQDPEARSAVITRTMADPACIRSSPRAGLMASRAATAQDAINAVGRPAPMRASAVPRSCGFWMPAMRPLERRSERSSRNRCPRDQESGGMAETTSQEFTRLRCMPRRL
jgi:hypothetical protein